MQHPLHSLMIKILINILKEISEIDGFNNFDREQVRENIIMA